MRDLLVFLEQWLDLERREHAMLRDVVRHETALAQLRNATVPAIAPLAAGRFTGWSVPRIRGEIVLHEMRCNPRSVAVALRQSKPSLDEVPLDIHYFCYWRTSEIQLLELDALGYYLLTLVDGARSVADLGEALVGIRRPSRTFLRLLSKLGDAGVLGTA
jgi:hypothetical protein